ncbi:hypothetical protein BKA70DRAFT_1438424 [Coprinopsis sp. MPI-PUGE-AT-0042]|nr:hypothetical protein BKA70DRAFT_1438424 [Coprinopsis sp. MPI-PUGE-AT-0042]
MAELDAPEDDGVVYDEEDEFSTFVNPVTLEVGPSRLQGASKTVGGTLRGKAAFSNMADLELEKIVSETVAIPRKARVFLDPLVSLGLVNRLVPDFFITVNGSTVKDVLNAIVEGDPSYAEYFTPTPEGGRDHLVTRAGVFRSHNHDNRHAYDDDHKDDESDESDSGDHRHGDDRAGDNDGGEDEGGEDEGGEDEGGEDEGGEDEGGEDESGEDEGGGRP